MTFAQGHMVSQLWSQALTFWAPDSQPGLIALVNKTVPSLTPLNVNTTKWPSSLVVLSAATISNTKLWHVVEELQECSKIGQ